MPGIDDTLGLKTADFTKGLQSVAAGFKSIGSMAAKATAAAGLAAGAGMGAALFTGIKAAAARESLETAFIPLLGSVQAAKDRMAELAQFANTTPFELNGVASASKLLQSLTGGALASGQALTMVGDAAAVAGVEYDQMAKYVGQLYSGLQKGGTFGESLEMLPQLGIVGPAVKQQLIAMKEAGEPFQKMWPIVVAELGKVGGAMALMANTWEGKMSTLGDSWNELKVSFGTPIIDALKPYLEGATSQLDGMRAQAEALGLKLAEAFGVLRIAAADGNLLNTLASGLKLAFLEAANTLAKALTAVAAGAKAAFAESGIFDAMKLAAEGIGAILSKAILEALNALPGLNLTSDIQFQDSKAATMLRAAGQMMNNIDLDKSARAGAAAYKTTWDNTSDMQYTVDARKEWADKTGPYLAQARADAAERKQAQEDLANEIAARKQAAAKAAPPTGAPAAKAALADRQAPAAGPNWLERLGFLGGGMNPRARSTAERQASLMERQLTLLARIETHLASPTPVPAAF